MDNILVTGANGQLGSELKYLKSNFTNYNFIFTDSKQLDITEHKKVYEFVKTYNINTIINCAAFTNVDKAETEIEKANQVNNLAVKNMANIAKERDIRLIHISTDYVFDGKATQPYLEDDITQPLGVYGKSKLDGEKAMKEINPRKSIIIRTSWLFSFYGENFMKKMLNVSNKHKKLDIISNQVGCPTFAGDLAKTILQIIRKIKNDQVEIYHYSNEGECSWFDFAKLIFEVKNISVDLNPIKTQDFRAIAKRPKYSVMDKRKIKKTFQLEILNWKDALKTCLRQCKN